jgi:uncharacterized membrane protein YhaH (DUF805 family)
MTVTQLLFSFQGRINRTKFWLGLLTYFLVTMAWYFAAAFFYMMSRRPDHETLFCRPVRVHSSRNHRFACCAVLALGCGDQALA